ncbi:MAG: ATP-binding protein [Chloroflexi bacterium]|nr:ATP-binding protein [Chloroflexota bacterium]
MISLSEFFILNRQIILFVYGLGFFILGFAILLQVRQSSRLDLARSLRWLAVFGIFHAFNEWGDLFIPIQDQYLSPAVVNLLWIMQILLLGGSFACLFEFGVAVLRPLGRARWLHGFAAGLLLLWIFVIFFVLTPVAMDVQSWRRVASALARYFIGFPGGLLAAYGLRVHAVQRIKPLNVPAIYQMLQIAGLSLGVYAFLAGLIPAQVDFFPGNLLNTQTFVNAIGIPVLVFRSLISLVIAIAIIRALEIFDVETERRIEALEQQQIILAEHERLARELHDGAIQKVYTAGLLVESASRLAQPGSEIGGRLDRSLVVLNDSIVDLRRNLAELHTDTIPVAEPVPDLLQQLAHDPHYNSLVTISLDLSLPEQAALSPMRTAHLMAIINEAMANIVRHADARNVKIKASDLGERLAIEIQDDGIGISSEARPGYGLSNMRDRARLLNGTLEFSGKGNRGTRVTLQIPWID